MKALHSDKKLKTSHSNKHQQKDKNPQRDPDESSHIFKISIDTEKKRRDAANRSKLSPQHSNRREAKTRRRNKNEPDTTSTDSDSVDLSPANSKKETVKGDRKLKKGSGVCLTLGEKNKDIRIVSHPAKSRDEQLVKTESAARKHRAKAKTVGFANEDAVYGTSSGVSSLEGEGAYPSRRTQQVYSALDAKHPQSAFTAEKSAEPSRALQSAHLNDVKKHRGSATAHGPDIGTESSATSSKKLPNKSHVLEGQNISKQKNVPVSLGLQRANIPTASIHKPQTEDVTNIAIKESVTYPISRKSEELAPVLKSISTSLGSDVVLNVFSTNIGPIHQVRPDKRPKKEDKAQLNDSRHSNLPRTSDSPLSADKRTMTTGVGPQEPTMAKKVFELNRVSQLYLSDYAEPPDQTRLTLISPKKSKDKMATTRHSRSYAIGTDAPLDAPLTEKGSSYTRYFIMTPSVRSLVKGPVNSNVKNMSNIDELMRDSNTDPDSVRQEVDANKTQSSITKYPSGQDNNINPRPITAENLAPEHYRTSGPLQLREPVSKRYSDSAPYTVQPEEVQEKTPLTKIKEQTSENIPYQGPLKIHGPGTRNANTDPNSVRQEVDANKTQSSITKYPSGQDNNMNPRPITAENLAPEHYRTSGPLQLREPVSKRFSDSAPYTVQPEEVQGKTPLTKTKEQTSENILYNVPLNIRGPGTSSLTASTASPSQITFLKNQTRTETRPKEKIPTTSPLYTSHSIDKGTETADLKNKDTPSARRSVIRPTETQNVHETNPTDKSLLDKPVSVEKEVMTEKVEDPGSASLSKPVSKSNKHLFYMQKKPSKESSRRIPKQSKLPLTTSIPKPSFKTDTSRASRNAPRAQEKPLSTRNTGELPEIESTRTGQFSSSVQEPSVEIAENNYEDGTSVERQSKGPGNISTYTSKKPVQETMHKERVEPQKKSPSYYDKLGSFLDKLGSKSEPKTVGENQKSSRKISPNFHTIEEERRADATKPVSGVQGIGSSMGNDVQDYYKDPDYLFDKNKTMNEDQSFFAYPGQVGDQTPFKRKQLSRENIDANIGDVSKTDIGGPDRNELADNTVPVEPIIAERGGYAPGRSDNNDDQTKVRKDQKKSPTDYDGAGKMRPVGEPISFSNISLKKKSSRKTPSDFETIEEEHFSDETKQDPDKDKVAYRIQSLNSAVQEHYNDNPDYRLDKKNQYFDNQDKLVYPGKVESKTPFKRKQLSIDNIDEHIGDVHGLADNTALVEPMVAERGGYVPGRSDDRPFERLQVSKVNIDKDTKGVALSYSDTPHHGVSAKKVAQRVVSFAGDDGDVVYSDRYGNLARPSAPGHGGAPSRSGHEDAPSRSGHGGAPSRSGHGGAPSRSGHEGAPSRSGHEGAPSRSGHEGAPSRSGHEGAPSRSGHEGASSRSGHEGAPSRREGAPDGSQNKMAYVSAVPGGPITYNVFYTSSTPNPGSSPSNSVQRKISDKMAAEGVKGLLIFVNKKQDGGSDLFDKLGGHGGGRKKRPGKLHGSEGSSSQGGPSSDDSQSGRRRKKKGSKGFSVEESPSGNKITQRYPCGCYRTFNLDPEKELINEELVSVFCTSGSKCEVPHIAPMTYDRLLPVTSSWESSLSALPAGQKLLPEIEIVADGVISRKPIPPRAPAPKMKGTDFTAALNIKTDKFNGVLNFYLDPRLKTYLRNNMDNIKLFLENGKELEISNRRM